MFVLLLFYFDISFPPPLALPVGASLLQSAQGNNVFIFVFNTFQSCKPKEFSKAAKIQQDFVPRLQS